MIFLLSAEPFSQKALYFMCENQEQFVGKTLPEMKRALIEGGIPVGDVFFGKYKELLFICAIKDDEIKKVMQKVQGNLSDDPDAVHAQLAKKLRAIAKDVKKKKLKVNYPQALKILQRILTKTYNEFF